MLTAQLHAAAIEDIMKHRSRQTQHESAAHQSHTSEPSAWAEYASCRLALALHELQQLLTLTEIEVRRALSECQQLSHASAQTHTLIEDLKGAHLDPELVVGLEQMERKLSPQELAPKIVQAIRAHAQTKLRSIGLTADLASRVVTEIAQNIDT